MKKYSPPFLPYSFPTISMLCPKNFTSYILKARLDKCNRPLRHLSKNTKHLLFSLYKIEAATETTKKSGPKNKLTILQNLLSMLLIKLYLHINR